MTTFEKLNLKDQKEILVLNAPESFERELKALRETTVQRDSGSKVLGDAGFEPARMVAIDEDFSALRFRRVEFIKMLTRGKEHRMSAQGKARAARK